MNFPTELTEAVEYLSGLVTINEDHEDGRVNSIADEETVISLLEEKYGDNVQRPNTREFFDVRLFGHPIQIKSSSYSRLHPITSSKSKQSFTLTTLTESRSDGSSWLEKFESSLLQHKRGQ